MRYPCDAVASSSVVSVAAASPPYARWILAATILGSSLAFIDGTVVNVALPALQVSLHATVSDVQWVVESYALFLASLLLVGGKMGDLYGRRRVFTLGVLIFALASAWCGFATTMRGLIIARAVQGIGAALLVPGSLAIISAVFPPEERGKAIGTWSGFTGITAAIGPVLGGWLVQHISWRWVFFINLPIAAAVLIVSFWCVPESRSASQEHKLDLPGAFLITLGLGALVFSLIEAPNLGWKNPLVWGGLVVAGIAMSLFVVWEERTNQPLLPLTIFRSRNFSGANLLTLFLYAALGAVLFFLPFNLIQIQGYTPTQTGAANLPLILILFFLSRWSGGLVAQVGARLPLVVGPVIAGAGFLLFARTTSGGSYWTTFFPAMVVLGLGMSAVVAPLTTTVMDSVSQEQSGLASGVNNAVSRVASLLAIAVLGLVAIQVFGSHLQQQLKTLGIPSAATEQIMQQRNHLTQIQLPSELDQGPKHAVESAIKQSFLVAFRMVMLLSAALSFLSALGALTMIDGRKRSSLSG